MSIDRITPWLLPLASFAFVATLSAEAEARRGLVVINTGEDVIEIAEIPADHREQLGIPGEPAVGVMYSHFGVFWLDIVRWDAKFVLYVDDGLDGFSYEEMPVEELAQLAKVSEDEVKKPMSYYFPPGGVLIGLLFVVGVPWHFYSEAQAGKRRAALLEDPRYAAAVKQFEQEFDQADEIRLDNAVTSLSEQGVPAGEARENIMFLCELEEAE